MTNENAAPGTLEIVLTKIAETANSTLSKLEIGGEFICFALEDGYRATKIAGETRIPVGSYKIKPYRAGKFFARYRELWGHDFVAWLEKVPGFYAILIHAGNTVEDTRGCILVGMQAQYVAGGNFIVLQSRDAYQRLYKRMETALLDGLELCIDVGR